MSDNSNEHNSSTSYFFFNEISDIAIRNPIENFERIGSVLNQETRA